MVTYVVTYILERKQTKKHEVLFLFIKICINIMTVKQAEFMERYLNGCLQNGTDKKKNESNKTILIHVIMLCKNSWYFEYVC